MALLRTKACGCRADFLRRRADDERRELYRLAKRDYLHCKFCASVLLEGESYFANFGFWRGWNCLLWIFLDRFDKSNLKKIIAFFENSFCLARFLIYL